MDGSHNRKIRNVVLLLFVWSKNLWDVEVALKSDHPASPTSVKYDRLLTSFAKKMHTMVYGMVRVGHVSRRSAWLRCAQRVGLRSNTAYREIQNHAQTHPPSSGAETSVTWKDKFKNSTFFNAGKRNKHPHRLFIRQLDASDILSHIHTLHRSPLKSESYNLPV